MTPETLFARPLWLLALLPLAVLIVALLRYGGRRDPWLRVIDAPLLPVLRAGRHESGLPHGGLLVLALGWLLAVLALAAPRWGEPPAPLFERQSAVVVVLDRSTAGDGGLRTRIAHWLTARPVLQTGLVVYAGSAHEVLPPTPDRSIVAEQLQYLTADAMPRAGRRTALALAAAGDMLARAGMENGAVLLVTRGTANEIDRRSAARLAADGLTVSVLTPRPDDAGLTALADAGNGRVYAAAGPLPGAELLPRSRADYTRDGSEGLQEPGLGPYLLLALLPLAALGFRRGWLGVALLALLPWQEPAMAVDDWWRTPTQKAMTAYRAGDYDRAAGLFDDPEWQGVALYRAGDYLGAVAILGAIDSPRAHYNRGNALARMGRFGEAIAAYEAALQLDRELADARYNMELLRRALAERRDAAVRRAEAEQGDRTASHPEPLLRDDPAGFWARKFRRDVEQRPLPDE